MSNLSALEKILWTINDDSKVDSSNIIEKLQSNTNSITRQTDGKRWKKSHNEVSKIVEV